MEDSRSSVGKRAGMVGIFTNLLLVVIKLIAGILSASVSITADALNNLTDATSSIVTLVGFKLSELPPDHEHPYGHARFEYVSGLVVAMLIFVIGFEMMMGSVKKIINPVDTKITPLILGILCISVGIKAGLYLYYKKKGEEISSSVLLASSVDSKNDAITTFVVLISMMAERYFQMRIDGFMGVAVAVFILYSGIILAKETVSPLLGEGVNEELKNVLEQYILSREKVAGCHDLMVHDYGPGKRFASIHIEMDKEEDPIVCHEILDKIERECLKKYGVNLVVHYDPIVTDDPELERLHEIVLSLLKMRDERLTIHDFRMSIGKENVNLLFDVVLPQELLGQEKEIQTSLEKALNSIENKTYFTVITFDIGFNS